MSYPARIDLEAAALLLRTLSNPARLRIALRLVVGECAVATLESELAFRQPNLSQQLAELRDAGLVTTRRESRTIFYNLAGDSSGGSSLPSSCMAWAARHPQPSLHRPRCGAASRPRSSRESVRHELLHNFALSRLRKNREIWCV
jgi:DNA-binding transcriptional ArsR family regulator